MEATTQSEASSLADKLERAIAVDCLNNDGTACRLTQLDLHKAAELLRSTAPIPVTERLPKPFDIPEDKKFAAWVVTEYLIPVGYGWVIAEYRSAGWFYRSRVNGEWLPANPSWWLPLPPLP